MNKANLYIVGVAKGGTTSLHTYLNSHPDISMSSKKEPNYFTWKLIKEQGLYYTSEKYLESEIEYLSLFPDSKDKKVLGEASVSYLFYPGTAAKIKEYNPEAKIIILLRDPVKRAFSHYLMDKRLGHVNKSLDSIFHHPVGENALHYQQYIQLGLYFSQVKEYLDIFDQEHIRIFLSSDLKKNTNGLLSDILSFLDLNGEIHIDTSSRHNVSGEGKNWLFRTIYKNRFLRKAIKSVLPKKIGEAAKSAAFVESAERLDPSLERELRAFYKPDILKLEKLINKDLAIWYE